MSVAKKHNYLNKSITTLKNTTVVEFDMQNAGMSILTNEKLLPQEDLDWLNTLGKKERHIAVGKMVGEDKVLSEALINTFVKVRERFMEVNQLQNADILSIKKDAIFVINPKVKHLEVDGYKFAQKNRYSSYYYLNGKEFYYSSWADRLDVKGLSKEVVATQQEYLLGEFKKLMRMNERLDYESMFRALKTFRQDYLERELEAGCYREFNSNKFRMTYKVNDIPLFSDEVSEEQMDTVDIGYNYVNYVIPLIGLIV